MSTDFQPLMAFGAFAQSNPVHGNMGLGFGDHSLGAVGAGQLHGVMQPLPGLDTTITDSQEVPTPKSVEEITQQTRGFKGYAKSVVLTLVCPVVAIAVAIATLFVGLFTGAVRLINAAVNTLMENCPALEDSLENIVDRFDRFAKNCVELTETMASKAAKIGYLTVGEWQSKAVASENLEKIEDAITEAVNFLYQTENEIFEIAKIMSDEVSPPEQEAVAVN